VRLTEAQCEFLRFAAAKPKELDGVYPRRGQHGMARLLAMRGLLRLVGPGVDADDIERRPVDLYVITDVGLAALSTPPTPNEPEESKA